MSAIILLEFLEEYIMRSVTQYCVYCHKTHAMSDARGPQNCEVLTDFEDFLQTPLALGAKIPTELRARASLKIRRGPVKKKVKIK